MARRSASSKMFKNDPQLQQYFLEGVAPTGKTLGVGSYGSVVEVEYKQISCAAKQMHELLDPSNEGVQQTIQRYQRECQLMACLRHPNITQFLGLCFLESSHMPLLVMERLEMSVDDLLECAPNIPLPVKLSILIDTCSGLVYLHGMKSPIVHRDLTARNVLLTSSLSAKITDLGNSRMVSQRSGHLSTLSKLPGTLVYMPPEALSDSQRYGPSLDMFSFGHLSLYTFTQVFPGELLSAMDMDLDNPGQVINRTEVKRREIYMKKLEVQFSESHPVLVQLVSQCLHNNPQARPSSEELLGKLHAVKTEVEKVYVGRQLNISNVLLVKEMKMKDKRIEELQRGNPVTFPLQLDWRRGPDMPFTMSYHIQSVEVDGTVYVGGGYADSVEDIYTVMAYDMQSCKWHTLPPYSAGNFAMTTINSKLILVGGFHDNYIVVDQVGVWKTDSNQWTHPFPPMPTSRSCPSAASYKHWVVAAGGFKKDSLSYVELSTVEVLDIDNKQWSTAPSTPIPWDSMKSTIIGDTWYLMGGRQVDLVTTDVYSVSLGALVSHSASDSSKIWNKIAPLKCYCSSPLSLRGSLLAIGGGDSKDIVSTIQRYVPETTTWVLAGELPLQLYDCTSIMTAGRIHVFGGYRAGGKLASYYFSDI